MNKVDEIMQDWNGFILRGDWTAEVTRANGDVEISEFSNQITAAGLNAIASRGLSDVTSPFAFISIGSFTNAASMGSSTWGEMGRAVNYINTNSKNVMVCVCTFAGAIDGITSETIYSGALVNHVNSGQGVALSITNSVFITLADSDFLKLTAEITVGSHNL